ncbi:MAG: right-handed parallel beta-helix repeat-containing protein [Planctomycetota bacterium]
METTIDGGGVGNVVVFENDEDPDSRLEGFEIRNGYALSGAGIYCYNCFPQIKDNIITANISGAGGIGGEGIGCDEAAPWIFDNIFSENTAESYGGGLSCANGSSPLVRGNTFLKNRGPRGGAICSIGASPVIEENAFTENEAVWGGGCIFCEDSNGAIFHNTFTGNFLNYGYLSHGGAIYCADSDVDIYYNTITGNKARFGGAISYEDYSSGDIKFNTITYNSGGVWGGAFDLMQSGPKIVNNYIAYNTAYESGALFSRLCNPDVIGNVIHGNVAEGGYSGGIFCGAGASIVDNIFSDNSTHRGNGGAIGCSSFGYYDIINNTFVNNYAGNGGAISLERDCIVTIVNCIFWDNQCRHNGPELYLDKSGYLPPTVTISHSNVKGGMGSVYLGPDCTLLWGDGMIDDDPLFADCAAGDFHLLFHSPCKDTGDNNALIAYQTGDHEGDPRVAYDTVDMGGDEFHPHLYYTDTAAPGGNIMGKIIGLPGSASVGLLLSQAINEPPMQHLWGDFHLAPPWYLFPVATLPSNGVLLLPVRIPSTPPAPYDLFMQALIDFKLTNLCVLEVR